MKKSVIVGNAFDSLHTRLEGAIKDESAKVIEAKTAANESKTRSNLAYGAIAGGALFIATSAMMGIYDDTFNELQSVWNICGPIVGGVFGHYFGGSERSDGGKKDEE